MRKTTEQQSMGKSSIGREKGGTWGIVGCGYVGQRLAARLIEDGQRVVATGRAGRLTPAWPNSKVELQDLPEFHWIQLSLGIDSTAPFAAALGDSATIVVLSPPSEFSPQAEAALASSLKQEQRLIYISTTGVYSAGDGTEVYDDHPVGPLSSRGQNRLDVENAILAAHENSVCLRVPGIYGLGRGVYARMKAGSYRILGEGLTSIARIHVDDLVSAICCLGEAKKLEFNHYLVGDLAPGSSVEQAQGISERTGLPLPEHKAWSEVSDTVRAMLSANRKILPRRLRALGWHPQYPSWKEGLEQILGEEENL